MSGSLYLVATPIGNKEDIGLRALRVLLSVDVVLAEDTRTTGRLLLMYDKALLAAVGVQPVEGEVKKQKLVRLDEYSERKMTAQVIEWLKAGQSVALVSESGMPLISDPGYLLVNECYRQGIRVEVVPGASALTAAVAVSGLPVDQILFLGFLPKKSGKRAKVLVDIKKMQANDKVVPTVVIYESPFRLKRTLAEVKQELGNPEVVLVGELTKKFEKVMRGRVDELLGQLPEKVKGEWVILVNQRGS